MNSLAYVDPLSFASKREVTVQCSECGSEYKIIVSESVRVIDLESYLCPSHRISYQVSDDPTSENQFEIFKEEFLDKYRSK